jgi:hypothetical protein
MDSELGKLARGLWIYDCDQKIFLNKGDQKMKKTYQIFFKTA